MADYKLQVSHPEAVKFTLTMTMTLADWRRLRDAFGNVQPQFSVSTMRDAIAKMVRQAEASFMPPVEPPGVEDDG